MKHTISAVGLGAVAVFLSMQGAALRAAVEPRVEMRAEPFSLRDVRLLEGPFREAMMRDRDYLLSLDPDRLLHTFRLNVGLPSAATPYGGWEEPKCELRGHSLGHYLSACALMYASSGEDKLKTRGDAIVAELAKCQQASPQAGYNQGYLSAFPESFLDRVEARQPVWAPWYTLHKIMAGLLDMYQYCGNAQALDVLTRQADWVKLRMDRLSPEKVQGMLGAEFGGMNEVLANLYAVTGNPDHLKLAQAFDHKAVFDPLARGEDKLNGLHANTQIPKFIGAAREYEMTADGRYRQIARFGWERVALHRSYVIGGHSDFEHFFPIEEFGKHLGTDTCETCNTYNMLKLTRHLFEWEPAGPVMDFYERALYNHILASQDPKTGMFVYLMPLKAGHFKTYSTPANSFWCCVGTGMENHAKYGDSIYFHDDDSLYVNLFIPSELTWKEHDLVVKQETKYPEENVTRITVKCGQTLEGSMKIRHPAWSRSLAITVNGKKEDVKSVPGSYAVISRAWNDGDRVEVSFAMELRAEALPGNTNTVAFLYGPIVLAGELGSKDLPDPYARNQTDYSKRPVPEAPVLTSDAGQILRQIEPVAGKPLVFRTRNIGQPADVTMVPLYRLHHQRYAVYWQLGSKQTMEK